MTRRHFRPTLWGTVLAICGIVAGIWLGLWQTGRAQQKIEVAQAMQRLASAPAVALGERVLDAGALEYRAVQARGEFEPGGMVLLDNRVRDKRAGYEVVMPLRLAGSSVYVLVNRGWVPGTGDRARLPQVTTPSGEVVVTGIAVIPGQKFYELSEQAPQGAVWQNLTIERYAARHGYRLQPVLVRQTNDAGDALVRDWAVSERSINVHRSYAFQWYALAVLVAVIYVTLSLKRDPEKS